MSACYRYNSATGQMFFHDDLLAAGYSGAAPWTNNPEGEQLLSLGPIPRGLWRMGIHRHHPKLGPIAIPLSPLGYIFGRSGFWIHGDNSKGDRSASSGCIILDRVTREKIGVDVRHGHTLLEVF